MALLAKLFIGTTILVFVLARCQSTTPQSLRKVGDGPTYTATAKLGDIIATPGATATPERELAKEWLAGRLCKPPCFLGIVPGQTSPEEALHRLQENSLVSNIKAYYLNPDSPQTPTGIDWRWVSSADDSRGLMEFDSGSHRLKYITVGFPERFSLQEVIEAYGEPSHVFAWSFHGQDTPTITEYKLNIVWLKQGFALGWRSATMPIISPTADSFFPFFLNHRLKAMPPFGIIQSLRGY